MRPTYVPPKGYSKPRNSPQADVSCQRCGSSAHWTFECTVSAVLVESVKQQNLDKQQDAASAPPDTRNPMWRSTVDDPTDETKYTAAEIAEVKELLREQVRKEILSKYSMDEMAVEVESGADSTSDESD